MSKNTETELKLQITDRKTWCDILSSSQLVELANLDSFSTETLEACYYDTADRALRRAGFAYRIRREAGQWVATVKGKGSSAGGLHTRQEWNVITEDCTASIKPFLATPVGERLQSVIGQKALELLFITRFERRTLLVRTPDGSTIEAAADRGEIIADGKREAILELELELKEGNVAALLDLGAVLAGQYPLVLEPRSKYLRGLLLSGIEADIKVSPLVTDELDSENLIKAITQVLNAQSYFLRLPDKEESIIMLRASLDYLRKFIDIIARDMNRELFKYVKECLDQFMVETGKSSGKELVALLGNGRYTALLLKMWAWAVKRAPESV